jgi:hypothetical protein
MEEQQVSDTQRDPNPVVPEETKKRVTDWVTRIKAAKEHWGPVFKRIREDIYFAKHGADKDWVQSGAYVVPIVNRHINQAVAGLYAKNPTATAKRRKRLMNTVWDGKPDSLQAAIDTVTTGMPDPGSMAILADAVNTKTYNDMLDRVGDTLEILSQYFDNEQRPTFKRKMKAMVRRAKTTGVAYIELGFERAYGELTDDESAILEDSKNRLAEIERRVADAVDGEMEPDSAEISELQTTIEGLQAKPDIVMREGPVDMFPAATSIIVDPCCKSLDGFQGAGWIAREFHDTRKDIQKKYKVDIGTDYTQYTEHGSGEMATYHAKAEGAEDAKEEGLACYWKVWDKTLGQVFLVVDGYDDFLKPPAPMEFDINGFFPVFSLTFNDAEPEEEEKGSIFPISDVRALRHTQQEYNRSRELRRLHRQANIPKYAAKKGRLSDKDKDSLASPKPHEVIELDSMKDGEKIDDLLQMLRTHPLDPALYETNSEVEDVLRTVGTQEANLGGVGGETATETSIAENSRMTSVSSNIDDLDDLLTEYTRARGQVMLSQMSEEMVKQIAGPGAVWPTLSSSDIIKEVWLEVEAGSSGRPNRASELANLERGMPALMQLPGINPTVLGRKYATLLDMNPDELVMDGLPSVQALNSMFGKMAGPPMSSAPDAQGGQGGANQEKPPEAAPGGQPAHPSGDEMTAGEHIN